MVNDDAGENVLIMTAPASICSLQTFMEISMRKIQGSCSVRFDEFLLENVNKSSKVLDSHCKCCFIIMPEAVCYCVVSVDGQLDTRTLCLT